MEYRIVLTSQNEVGFQVRFSSMEIWKGKTIFANIGKGNPCISFNAFEKIQQLESLGYNYQGTITMKSEELWNSL